MTKLLLTLLFLFGFRQGFLSIWEIMTASQFQQNALAFVLILALYIFLLIKKRKTVISLQHPIPPTPLISLITLTLLFLLNSLFLHFSLLPAVLTILAAFALSGFFLAQNFWRRSFFVFLTLTFALPILERFQKFLGFPLRLLTASAVSQIFQFLAVAHLSNSAIIITENHATSIDLPCSGVKSLYTGTLFLTATAFLQNLSVSLKFILISIVFFALLIFFNIWRVFSLVYIYDILGLTSFGNSIHVTLGVVGFLASCTTLWWLQKKYLQPNSTGADRQNQNTKGTSAAWQFLVTTVLIVNVVISFLPASPKPQPAQISDKTFTLSETNLTPVPFSSLEQSYFQTSGVEYSSKFTGRTSSGTPFTLLIVSSKSARAHHDPETCLAALGHSIEGSEINQVAQIPVRKLTMNQNQNLALYWYVGKDKVLLDYSQRVWEEVSNPNQTWVLIILGFNQKMDLSSLELQGLITEINQEAKELI